MSHKNYHNYSKPFNKDNGQELKMPTSADAIEPEETTITSPEIPPVDNEVRPTPDETAEVTVDAAPELPTVVSGIVSGCKKLNVRNRPNITAGIVTTIGEGTEVEIAQPVVNGDFYKVTLANGLTGYCMKKFITVK